MELIGPEFDRPEFEKMKIVVTSRKQSLIWPRVSSEPRKYEWWTNPCFPFKYIALPAFFVTSSMYSIHILDADGDDMDTRNWEAKFEMLTENNKKYTATSNEVITLDSKKVTITYNQKEIEVVIIEFKFVKTGWQKFKNMNICLHYRNKELIMFPPSLIRARKQDSPSQEENCIDLALNYRQRNGWRTTNYLSKSNHRNPRMMIYDENDVRLPQIEFSSLKESFTLIPEWCPIEPDEFVPFDLFDGDDNISADEESVKWEIDSFDVDFSQ